MEGEDLECLAQSLVRALAENVTSLSILLASEPTSEPGLTGIADLALLSAILERDHQGPESVRLSDAVRVVLAEPALRPNAGCPGPEQWALHAARAWLAPSAEVQLLSDRYVRRLVAESERMILDFGPPWRPDEVAHVNARLTGSDLPPLHTIDVASVDSLYELAHITFYTTDFGVAPAAGELAGTLASTAARIAGELAYTEWGWDVGTELILASRFLSGGWPPEADAWIRHIIPQRSRVALATLCSRPDQFLSQYHSMALSALVIARAVTEGGTS